MKTIRYILLLLITAFSLTSHAKFVHAELQVSGLTCSMCSKATEKSLRTLDFIQDIKVDLNEATYTITFKDGKEPSMDRIAQKVKDAGFSVHKLIGYFDFKGLKVKKDYHFSYGGDIYHFMNTEEKLLNGKTALTFIDKGFLPSKQYNKFLSQTTFLCYKTGYMEKCCNAEGNKKTRVYHVTI
jgi:copper chaperone CopZ